MTEEDKDKKKETSDKKDEESNEEENEESEEEFEGFSEDEDFRIDLSGFSGERQAGVLHSDEKPRNLESQVVDAPVQEKREKGQGRDMDTGRAIGAETEIKQDLYSEAQLYNEQIKKYQNEITIDLNQGGRRGGKLERESIITPRKAEGLMARSTELRQHENFREDYVAYESKNLRGNKDDTFVSQEKKHKEDVRKYIAKGR